MKRSRMVLLCALGGLLCAGGASASIFDDTEDLAGKVVIAAGNFDELPCSRGAGYNCNTWPDGLMRSRRSQICFAVNTFTCMSSCQGILAVGEDRVPYFFEFERYGGGTKKYPAQRYDCPSG